MAAARETGAPPSNIGIRAVAVECWFLGDGAPFRTVALGQSFARHDLGRGKAQLERHRMGPRRSMTFRPIPS
jgi:hypothetical protein